MITGMVQAGARVEWQTFRAAVNATSPFWNQCRSSLGYFVVEHRGSPCWVGRTSGAGLKVALVRWIESGAPADECFGEDVWDTRILFVTLPESAVNEGSMPGRVI